MRNTSIHGNFLFLTFADVKMEHNLSFSSSANGPYDDEEHLSIVLLLL